MLNNMIEYMDLNVVKKEIRNIVKKCYTSDYSDLNFKLKKIHQNLSHKYLITVEYIQLMFNQIEFELLNEN